jgi:cell division protein FtsQ
MDGQRRIGGTLKGWLGGSAGTFALYRAGRAANRRAQPKFYVPRGIGSTFAILFLLGCAGSGFVLGGHDVAFRREHGTLRDFTARAFGFGIDHIAVSGNVELQANEVIELSGLQSHASLPFLDVQALQQQLNKVPLIAEASVTKLYPDRLKIDIRERVPYALWQLDGVVNVIAADGTAIEKLSDQRFLRLPHVVGQDANLRVKDYAALVDAVPDLAPRIKAGTLVSGRRWNLKLDNGIDLRLPELGAVEALKAFAKIEKETALSQRAVLAIDLRVPDRVIVRLTEEAAASHAESVTARIKKAGGRV